MYNFSTLICIHSFNANLQVIRLVLSLGVLDALLPVSLVSEVVVLTDLVREPLATCAEEDVCLPRQRHGEDGTER